jgi:hypothetical protein
VNIFIILHTKENLRFVQRFCAKDNWILRFLKLLVLRVPLIQNRSYVEIEPMLKFLCCEKKNFVWKNPHRFVLRSNLLYKTMNLKFWPKFSSFQLLINVLRFLRIIILGFWGFLVSSFLWINFLIFLWMMVFRYRGSCFKVKRTRFQRLDVSWFLKIQYSRIQGFRILNFQDFKVSALRFSRNQDFRLL